MPSTINSKSPVRRDSSLTPIPLNCLHTSTSDFFRWHVCKMIPMISRDIISFSSDDFVQGAPNPFPISGSFTYGLHAFFVPNRLVWKDWKYYYTDLQSGLTPPYFTIGDLWDVFNTDSYGISTDAIYRAVSKRFISDIMGLGSILHFLDEAVKTDIPSAWLNLKLSAMPLRMVECAWFDWCRDKMHISDNAKASYCYDTGGHIDKAELALLCMPKFRNYPLNMFTGAFDTPQEGLGSSALGNLPSSTENPGFTPVNSETNVKTNSNDRVYSQGYSANANDVISSTPINELRYKNSLQQYRERLLVAGKTVVSRCLALMGVSPTIEELQMSVLIGGQDFELNPQDYSATQATSNSDSVPAQAGAFGYDPKTANISGQKGMTIVSPMGLGLKNIQYKADESGCFFVLGCITPNVQYYQGLPKDWTAGLDTFNSDKFDFFHSDMENQPLDPILFYEVCTNPKLSPKKIHGFQLMYARYKQALDSMGGEFIDNPSALFKSMVLGRDISALVDELSDGGDYDSVLTPANLRQSTLYDCEEFDKKFSFVSSVNDHFILNHKFTINMLRPMQLYSLPSLDSSIKTEKDLIETGGFSV